MSNNCDGCSSDTYYDKAESGGCCKFNAYNDFGKCPCTRCIIKMMCEDVCDDFDKFRIGIIEEIQHDS
jgi:hypothetical protein